MDCESFALTQSGIQPGDVIIAVGQDQFRSLEEFNKLFAQRKKAGQRSARAAGASKEPRLNFVRDCEFAAS